MADCQHSKTQTSPDRFHHHCVDAFVNPEVKTTNLIYFIWLNEGCYRGEKKPAPLPK